MKYTNENARHILWIKQEFQIQSIKKTQKPKVRSNERLNYFQ